MDKEEEQEKPTYLDNIRTLVKTLTENQDTLDSKKKLKLRDVRQYVADLNFSFLEILKKLEKSIKERKNPQKKEEYFI